MKEADSMIQLAENMPGVFHLIMATDVAFYLTLSVTMLALASLLRYCAPIRGTLLAVCGIAQLTGIVVGFMRSEVVEHLLASGYITADPEKKMFLLGLFDLADEISKSFYLSAYLMAGFGFLLAAWITFSLPGFPQWLAACLAFPALTGLVLAIFSLFGESGLFPLVLTHALLAVGGVQFALALSLWRPSSVLISEITKQ
jgi:hypothetical protein